MNSNSTADDLVRLFREEAIKRREGTVAPAPPVASLNLPRVRGLPAVRELPRNGVGPSADVDPQLRASIEQIHGDLTALHGALRPIVEDLQTRANELTVRLHQTQHEALTRVEELSETRWSLSDFVQDLTTTIARVDALAGAVHRAEASLAEASSARQTGSDALAAAEANFAAFQDASAAAQTVLSEAVGRLETRLSNETVYLKAQIARARAAARPAAKPRRAAHSDPTPALAAGSAEMDAFYLAFENEFRGTPAEIERRLEVYLPFLDNTGAAEGGGVLDLGCGRGEWLELLRARGIENVSGVDLNTSMVEHCTGRGLTVVHADALTQLRSHPDESLVAISSFHLIEHLPFPLLMELLHEILRTLAPGGVTILETPNPRNILVGASDFYRDMTHNRPLHPDTMRFTLQTIGFAEPGCYFLQDDGERRIAVPRREYLFPDLQSYVDVPRDYAVIGRKL